MDLHHNFQKVDFSQLDFDKKFGIYSDFFYEICKLNTLVFINKDENAEYNQYVSENFEWIENQFRQKNRGFTLLPKVYEEKSLLDYFLPGISDSESSNLTSSNTDSELIDFLGFNQSFRTGIISFHNSNIVFVEKNELETIEDFIRFVISTTSSPEQLMFNEPHIQFSFGLPPEYDENDKNSHLIEIDDETKEIVENIERLIDKMKDNGSLLMITPYLEKLLSKKSAITKPSPILITSDYSIILKDYDLEIKMSHLTKAVYFLFLLTNQPIDLNHIDKYKTEILKIYKHLSYRNSIDKLEESVEGLVDPMNNHIHTHLSRIKSAFVGKLSDGIAKQYYVTGFRGDPKSIKLDRSLVEWKVQF